MSDSGHRIEKFANRMELYGKIAILNQLITHMEEEKSKLKEKLNELKENEENE